MGSAGLWENFHTTLEHEGWLPYGGRVVAGVSGGSDSMALLGLLARSAPSFGWDLSVVHVHHGHRGEDADLDADLVRRWSAGLGIACVVDRVTVAPRGGESWEMAARDVRRTALLRHAGSDGRLVLAHHRDDQVETVLYRILRGTGVAGIAGMRPVAGPVVRPLLPWSRAELAAWREGAGIPCREDATNQSRRAVRNRIRHELLPHLADTYNPRVADAVMRLTQSAGELEDWADQEAAAWLSGHWDRDVAPGQQRLAGARPLPPALLDRVLRRVAQTLGFGLTEEQVRAARQGATGWPRRHQVAWHGEDLWIAGPPPDPVPFVERPLALPGMTALPDGQLWVADVPDASRPLEPPPPHLGRVLVSRVPALTVRGWQAGDRIALAGGTKKLQDVFVDARVPRRLRPLWPVVVDADGVAAVPGLAVAARLTPRVNDAAWALAWVRPPAGKPAAPP
ncbi:MAG: tRNA lysidine(34) synthetase TilS [Thermaerobacter sp.]|nr:tRNA lysidine(34) synthetase TilS [Thermaerobacter sp.]